MDGCLGVICFVESFPMLTYILDPNLNGCKAAQNGICLIPADVFFSLHIQILLGLFILKITVQATDNNFVGGDVIQNYFRIIFFLPKNHILVLSDCLFVNECLVLRCLHLFVFLSSARHRLLACLYSSTCTLRVCMTFSYCAENFRFLIVLKNFSTLEHKPSLFRFLDFGLVLPQEDGSSDDIGFLTSQWRLVCDRIFVLCQPSTSLHTISFFKKRYMCLC